jgi:DNA-binding transcriptional MerR regulator
MSNDDSKSELILSISTAFEKSFVNKIQKMNEFYDRIKLEPPSKLRKNYNRYYDVLENKEVETNTIIRELNDSIASITNSISKVNEINEILEKMKNIVNKGKVGTLEGITRENITNANIPVENLSESEQEVLNQDYNEFQRMSLNGGISKKNKGKKGKKPSKKRKTIKKRVK